jgi:hypothetical protein
MVEMVIESLCSPLIEESDSSVFFLSRSLSSEVPGHGLWFGGKLADPFSKPACLTVIISVKGFSVPRNDPRKVTAVRR